MFGFLLNFFNNPQGSWANKSYLNLKKNVTKNILLENPADGNKEGLSSQSDYWRSK
jgi:hypothetical protein